MANEGAAKPVSFERFAPLLLIVGLVCQAVLLGSHMGAGAGGADSSGYLNSARLLARGEFSTAIRPIAGIDATTLPDYTDEIFCPLGFRPILGRGAISPLYPPGLPLLIAAAAAATDWDVAAGLTLGVHAMLGLLLMYALGRDAGLSPGWAGIGTALLGTSPLYHFVSLQTLSDLPALVWTTGGLLCALRARRHPAWAAVAGFALGFAVLLRPTDALALLPALLALGLCRVRLLLFVGGGLPAAAAQACYNFGAYGHIFATGYFSPPDLFSLRHVGPTLWHYVTWLPVLLTPLVVAAWLLPAVRDFSRRQKLCFGTWILAFLGFYAAYSFTRETWWFLRFLLPAFPPLIVAALLVLRNYSGRTPGRVSPTLAWIAVFTMVVIHGAAWTRTLRAVRLGEQENGYRITTTWLQTHLPPKSIVCAMQHSGALFYYTNFALLRWDWVRPGQFRQIVMAAENAGRPIYAALHDFEQNDALTAHLPGRWTQLHRLRTTTIWKLELSPAPVPQSRGSDSSPHP